MPRANIFIRQSDWKKWTALEKKSEWVHGHLTSLNSIERVKEIESKPEVKKVKINKVKPKIIKTKDDAVQAATSIQLPKIALCKIHEIPLDFRGKCLQKGCKYA